MVVLYELPPIYPEIVAAFPEAPKCRAIFSWGEFIYNPWRAKIDQALHEHECVHGQRQGRTQDSIEGWWRRYIADHAFRLAEEVPAHVQQLRAYRKRHGDPAKVARMLDLLADGLSGELYGRLISRADARLLIARGG